VILGFAVTTAARFFTSMMDCVHGRPGSTFGLIFRDALFSIAFLDVLSLSLLFVCVFVFVPSGHRFSPFWISKMGDSHASFDLAWQLPNQARIKKQRTLINQIWH
jgi:hypothetical protein